MNFYTKGISASNMVLLQNAVNCVNGVAPCNSMVTMEFAGLNYSVQSDNDGNWKIEFNPGPAFAGRDMILRCSDEEITYINVAVGEVWICSGQSNMQLQMERLKYTYPDEFKKPENQNIRMITIPVTFDFEGPKDSVNNPEWKMPAPDTLSGMSGTSYFFAKKLSEDLGIPVGVIACCQGGTPVTAWMNGESMAGVGDYVRRLEELKKPGYVQSVQDAEKAAQNEWNKKIYELDSGMKEDWKDWTCSQAEEAGWGTCHIPGEVDLVENGGIVWFKKEVVLTADDVSYFKEKGARIWTGTIRDADMVFINGVQVGITYYVYPPRRYDIPDGILKEGVNTITLRVQQNLHNRKMFFWPEKHYALTSRDKKVIPTAIRNVEQVEGTAPLRCDQENICFEKTNTEGIYIPLNGDWFCCATTQIEDCPPNTFFEYEPQALYNAMLAPCFNTAVRGALWYQGESNDSKPYEYEELLDRMIKLWRSRFTYCPEKNMPFVVMQLPSWADDVLPDSFPVTSNWAEIREAQNGACEKNSCMALSVAIDAGEWNDLHPEKKLTGGTRAAEQALRLVYGKDYSECAKMNSMELHTERGLSENKENYCKVVFKTDNPLKAYAVENGAVDFSKETKEVFGFSLLLRNGFGKESVLAVTAEIVSENTVRLILPEIPLFTKIKEIRYLWANCPECVNLYSGTLPAMPGRIKV